MKSRAVSARISQQLHVLSYSDSSDAQLLGRYVGVRDEAAFAEVVRRYGRLVLGVARRQLADHALAEDVFQATFLALARAAARLHRRQPLANWLYTVALRLAKKARLQAARRRARETACARPATPVSDPLTEISGRELLGVLDEELARLPEPYRLPLLLCSVQGLSREEAARRLGWSDGEVKGRLERGRCQLASRLAARGFAPAALALAPLAAVALPADLLARTTPLGTAPWSPTLPVRVASLAASATSHRLLLLAVLVGALTAVGLAGLALAGGKESMASDPPPATRAEEGTHRAQEPLPPGSSLRFGTARYRQGTVIRSLSISADDALAIATSGNHVQGAVRVFDLTTGAVRATIPPLENLPVPFCEAVALSPDGRRMAIRMMDDIRLLDTSTANDLRLIHVAGDNGHTETGWLLFAPDGKRLAAASPDGKVVCLYDVEAGTLLQTLPHQNVVFAAAFAPDGKRLAAGGYDSEAGKYFARLWDLTTGKELRRFLSGNRGLRTLAFAPDGRTLAGGGDDAMLRLWDVETGKERHPFPADGYRIRSVAFSPDGQTIAAAGDTLRLYDADSGKERLHIARQALGLHFSAEGKVLTGAVSGTINRWDTATGKPLTPQDACDSSIDQVLPGADGRHVFARGQEGDVHVWDARTGAHLRSLRATWQRDIALSRDGRYLVWPVQDESVKYADAVQKNVTHTGNRLRLYDFSTDQYLERFRGFPGDAHFLTFTPDGKTLVTVDYGDGTVRRWDVETGGEQRSFQALPKEGKARPYALWHALLSPDGQTLAVSYQPDTDFILSPFTLRLWDLATGKEKHALSGHRNYVSGLAFSPDSRLLVTSSEPLTPFVQRQLNQSGNQVFVWEVASGQRVTGLPDGLPIGAASVAFAPDGRTVATAEADGTIKLWEVATWAVRRSFRGHRDRVTALALSPNGSLYSGGLDTTVVAWDTRPAAPQEKAPLDQAWEALAKTEAAVAFRAQGRLRASPAAAIALFKEKIKPAERITPKQITQMISDLDSSEFATREQAARALRELGGPAQVALREAAANSPSAEVRRRAAELVHEWDQAVPSARELQQLRAVEVLEWVHTPEARALLETWAKSAPGTPLGNAAVLAMARWK